MSAASDAPENFARSGSWLAEAIKLVIAARALALLLTLLETPEQGRVPVLVIAVIGAAIASYVPLRHWDRVAPALMRRPMYLAIEVALAVVILLITGTDSPFFLFTVGTAVLGGLIYGFPGAALFAALLVGAYVWVFELRSDVEGIQHTFQNVYGQPSLYIVAALAGAVGRRLFERQAQAAHQAQIEAHAAASERERARLARDMHDSLAKTVHGIALAAAALGRRIERDPEGAAADARRLAEDAETAAREARGLIYGLRHEGTEPLAQAVAERAASFAAEAGLDLETAIDEGVDVGPAARHELVQILTEALRNVERHASAKRVTVSLDVEDGMARLAVADDGVGFDPSATPARRYGIVGMRERATLVGGRLDVVSERGKGTRLTAVVPAGAAAPAPRAEEAVS